MCSSVNGYFFNCICGCGGLSVDEVTEKCYAIRGRTMKVNFSANSQPASERLPVELKLPVANEPYNGVFGRYGF